MANCLNNIPTYINVGQSSIFFFQLRPPSPTNEIGLTLGSRFMYHQLVFDLILIMNYPTYWSRYSILIMYNTYVIIVS